MKAARDSRFCSLTWPGRTDTATSRTSLATSTAMVVDFIRAPPSLSVQRRNATLAHPMPREPLEESITSVAADGGRVGRSSDESTSELQPRLDRVGRLLLDNKNKTL